MRVSSLLAFLPLAMAVPSRRASPAPVLVPRGAQVLEGKYIVKMKTEAQTSAVESAISGVSAGASHRYSHSFSGFAAALTPRELETLQNDPNVSFPLDMAQKMRMEINLFLRSTSLSKMLLSAPRPSLLRAAPTGACHAFPTRSRIPPSIHMTLVPEKAPVRLSSTLESTFSTLNSKAEQSF